MKDLRTLLEASILDNAISEASLLDNAISEASLLDIEGTLDKKIDFKTLVNSKTQREFLSTANILKNLIEEASPKTYKYNELKKGKPYIFMYDSVYGEDDFVIAFVDKWPITAKSSYLTADDAFYEIFWEDNKVKVVFDDTGTKFSATIRDNNSFNKSYGPYEVPKEYLKDLKELIKTAERW